jgi:hypothetical protein
MSVTVRVPLVRFGFLSKDTGGMLPRQAWTESDIATGGLVAYALRIFSEHRKIDPAFDVSTKMSCELLTMK